MTMCSLEARYVGLAHKCTHTVALDNPTFNSGDIGLSEQAIRWLPWALRFNRFRITGTRRMLYLNELNFHVIADIINVTRMKCNLHLLGAAMQRKQNSDGGSTCTASSASSFPQVDVIGSDFEGNPSRSMNNKPRGIISTIIIVNCSYQILGIIKKLPTINY